MSSDNSISESENSKKNVNKTTTKTNRNRARAKKEKKIFYINNNENQPIMSAGLLIYKIEDDKVKVLMSFSGKRKKYEDLGGQIELTDKCLHSTINREVIEETNGVIKLTKKRTRQAEIDGDYFYNVKSKYVVFLVKATPYEELLDSKNFGDCENKDNLVRTISWQEVNIFSDIKNINFRLITPKLFAKLRQIEPNVIVPAYSGNTCFSKRLI